MNATTYLNNNGHIYQLSNKVLTEYLSNNLNLDIAVVNNPYFIYKLFDIFGIDKHSIQSIKVFKDKIVINTNYYEYEIVVNSQGGLTAIIEEQNDDYDTLYYKSRKIVEIIPNNGGILLINHSDTITGSLIDFDCNITKRLELTNIGADGIVNSTEEVVISSFEESDLFSHKPSIEPYTMNEYLSLMDRYKSIENKWCKHIDRTDINVVNIYRENESSITRNTQYFNSDNVLDIIDLKDIDFDGVGLKKKEIISKLHTLVTYSDVEAAIANTIGNRLGIKLGKKCENEATLKDVRLISSLLKPEGGKIKKFCV